MNTIDYIQESYNHNCPECNSVMDAYRRHEPDHATATMRVCSGCLYSRTEDKTT